MVTCVSQYLVYRAVRFASGQHIHGIVLFNLHVTKQFVVVVNEWDVFVLFWRKLLPVHLGFFAARSQTCTSISVSDAAPLIFMHKVAVYLAAMQGLACELRCEKDQ